MQAQRQTRWIPALLLLLLTLLLAGGAEYIIRLLPPAEDVSGTGDLLAATPTIAIVVRIAAVVLVVLAAWRLYEAIAHRTPATPTRSADAEAGDATSYAGSPDATYTVPLDALRPCPHCGVRNLARALFCEGCGQPMPRAVAPDSLACAACGHLNPGDYVYCEACGAALSPEEPEAVSELCRSCGHANPPGALFCQRCGRVLAQPESAAAAGAITCPACGAARPAGTRFCPQCGRALSGM